jgi:hypothetical protein
MTYRWSLPLPSIGRAGPRIEVSQDTPLDRKIEEYYLSLRSVPGFFTRRVSYDTHRRLKIQGPNGYLKEYSWSDQYRIIMSQLWIRDMSRHFQNKLTLLLRKGKLNQVEQWFHTADGLVLPLIILGCEDTTKIDRLTRFALENCANNYAQFISRLKQAKKRLRKYYATEMTDRSLIRTRDMSTYVSISMELIEVNLTDPSDYLRACLVLTQSRGTGLADGSMIRRALDKFARTITTPVKPLVMDPITLMEITRPARYVSGTTAKFSAGPTGCFESTREEGGQTAALANVCSRRCLRRLYNLRTLEVIQEFETPRVPHTAEEVLQWAVGFALDYPQLVRAVRAHAVSEPSKARVITIAPLAYMIIMHVFGHLWSGTLRRPEVRSGMTATRHLWKFLDENLHPKNGLWNYLPGNQEIWALSSDLEEATDYGNPSVARQIWSQLSHQSQMGSPAFFPTGLAFLAKQLFCGPRYVYMPDGSILKKERGWFMGDPMTKVILTYAQSYCYHRAKVAVGSLVGDDILTLDHDVRKLEQHLQELRLLDFKVSEDDTFISRQLMFYCEEGARVPQRASHVPAVQIRRGVKSLGYIDYPRTRLLIPTKSELDRFSMTNVGRFSLLGKECIWVESTNPRAKQTFRRASVLQHLTVPQDADCLSPYLPIEIGGDGAYYGNAGFIARVYEAKARDYNEVTYRMRELMHNTYGYRYIRSERTNQTIHKYHLWAPIISKLEHFIPEDAIVTPETEEHRVILQSLRSSNLEDPTVSVMRLAKAAFYRSVLYGRIPTVFRLDNRSRAFHRGHGEIRSLNFTELVNFLRFWRNPGFSFRNQVKYFVRKDKIVTSDYLSLGWDFHPMPIEDDPEDSLGGIWGSLPIDEIGRNFQQVEEALYGGAVSLPPRVENNLNLYVESDNWIIHKLSHREDLPDVCEIALVSADIKLAHRILRLLRRNHPLNARVVVIHPVVYLLGRVWELDPCPIESIEVIEDAGAIWHADLFYFEEGDPGSYYEQEITRAHARGEPQIVIYSLGGLTAAKEGEGTPQYITSIDDEDTLVPA